MTRLDYELLREAEPQLRLPRWEWLAHTFRAKATGMKQQELIAARTAVLLGRANPRLEYFDGTPSEG